MNEMFLSALPVIRKIEHAGFEAFFVGGAVRDHLLKKGIHDVDIATSATPLEIKSIFPATVDVGIEHGTILVLYEGQGFEITTYRSEADYEDFRRPQSVTFIRSLEEDLQRRDFTMNAMAMDADGNIIDPFDGKKALNQKIIETVGNASDRFQEDALRLMRAIRFVGQLGFTLEKKTELALANHASLLQHIAIERTSEEMTKLLQGPFKTRALQLALQTNLYQYWPSIMNEALVLESVFPLPIEQLNEVEMWTLFLFQAKIEQPRDALKKWKLPSKKMKLIQHVLFFLYRRLKSEWTNVSLYEAGKEVAVIVEHVYQTISQAPITDVEEQIDTFFKQLPIVNRSELVVTGNDILDWVGQPAGPWMKNILVNLEKAVLNNEIENNREVIRGWVENCHNQLEDN